MSRIGVIICLVGVLGFSSAVAQEVGVDPDMWGQLTPDDKARIQAIMVGSKLISPETRLVEQSGARLDERIVQEERFSWPDWATPGELKKRACKAACDVAATTSITVGCTALTAGVATAACGWVANKAKEVCKKAC
jgi:hypothetical protein